ncbi:MAG: DUF4832 domain-containing protein [Verrucomicrobia bacterium]|nr:DUF4832 domain-containing protein [Verrucomicrobiota bacterium]
MSQTKVVGSGEPVPLPSLQTRLTIIDACRDAFPAKAKVMLIGDIEGMRHAVQNGCGWRADCLGDMGGFSKNWNHMRDLYPQHVQQAGAGEVWKQGPVAFESCWDMQKWKREGWDVRHIFDYALGMHVSYMNNKSAPIPDGTRGEVERFLRKIGYRLVLRRLEHEARVKTGEKLAVSMGWENVGVAPPYGDHLVAFRLARQGEAKEKAIVSVGKTSIRGWLPGKKEVAESVAVPSKLAAGTCELAVAVVEPLTDEPAVRLANLGRDPAGWYPVSRVEVTEAE